MQMISSIVNLVLQWVQLVLVSIVLAVSSTLQSCIVFTYRWFPAPWLLGV
jgi:hypothetical protein